jgi:hypothetical protein
MAMLRPKLFTVFVLALCFFGVVVAGCAHTQKVKTITLPSGEEVMDISGLYDTQIAHYGSWSVYGSYSTVTEIRQEGSSFVGIRKKAKPYHSAGSVSFQGELDKNGIKKLQLVSRLGFLDATGQISDDGKIITMDANDKARSTMTRKE